MPGRAGPQRPLVLVGTGRCGSTLLHRLLAEHRDLAWLSPYNEVLPALPEVSLLSAAYRLPVDDRIREAKAFPKPFESYRFWEHHLPGFSRRDRPLRASDVAAERIEPVRAASRRVVRCQRGSRLLVKVTGWSRVLYFDRIFPDAVFVSLRRDPRAVVSSWVKADWLDVSTAPDQPGWQWGEVPDDYLAAWRDLGGDAFLSAALKVRLDLDDIALNTAEIPARCHEIWYEDLIREPISTLREVCEFAGLTWSAHLQRLIERKQFHDPSGKWRKHLGEEDAERVLEFLRRTDRIVSATREGSE